MRFVLTLAALLALLPVVISDESERHTLGLYGCNITDAAVSADAQLTVASCTAPRGLYFSSNFGESWHYAEGGSYTSGAVSSVAIADHGVYALRKGGALLSTSLASAEALTPDWVEIANPDSSKFPLWNTAYARMMTAGNFLLIPFRTDTDSPIYELAVLDTSSNQYTQYKTVPGSGEIPRSLAMRDSSLFLLTRPADQNIGRLYRTTIDLNTGTIGDWTDISSNVPFTLGSGRSEAFLQSVHTTSNSVIVRSSEPGATVQVFKSGTNGDSFSLVLPADSDQSYYNPESRLSKTCSSGSTVIVNNYLSKDDGDTWSSFKERMSTGFNLHDNDVCLFDPSDETANTVLDTRVGGFFRSSNLQAVSPTWTPAITGLEGITVNGVSRVTNESQDFMALVTNAGLAFTANFSDSDRSWQFPVCNGNKSCWSSSITLDPHAPELVFSGTEDVEIGKLHLNDSGNAEIDSEGWHELLDNPSGVTDGDDLPVDLAFRAFPQFPGIVFALYRWHLSSGPAYPRGGIYPVSYDYTDSVPVHSALDVILPGLPVHDLVAISDTVLYATVDYPDSDPSDFGSDPRGVYRIQKTGMAEFSATLETSGDMSSAPGVHRLAYDTTRDRLIAVTGSGRGRFFGSVYVLNDVLAGGGQWVKSEDPSAGIVANDLTVDDATGVLFASRSNGIWRSEDAGATWAEHFTGLEDEEFNALVFSSNYLPAPSSIKGQDYTQQSPAASHLVSASSIGLNAVAASIVTATPTPTPAKLKAPQIKKLPTELIVTCAKVTDARKYTVRFSSAKLKKPKTFSSSKRTIHIKRSKLRKTRTSYNVSYTVRTSGQTLGPSTVKKIKI